MLVLKEALAALMVKVPAPVRRVIVLMARSRKDFAPARKVIALMVRNPKASVPVQKETNPSLPPPQAIALKVSAAPAVQKVVLLLRVVP